MEMKTLIKSMEKHEPLEVLMRIKHQKGGFVTRSEKYTLKELEDQEILPDSVINVLIHYILVGKENDFLNQNYVLAIAKDWAKNKIHTAEEAVTYVRKLTRKQKSSNIEKESYKIRKVWFYGFK